MEKYLVQEPSKLTSDNDQRKIRVIAVAVLDQEVLKSNTIMPRDLLINRGNVLIFEPACRVSNEILKQFKDLLMNLLWNVK